MVRKTPKKSPSRRPRLSRTRVLKAAVRLADKSGIASLSMRKLARKLGVEAMSLYNHVSNKDDLLDGIVDMVATEIVLPEVGGDWQAAMRTRAHSVREVLLRHPWATMLIVSRANVGPAMLAYVDATIGCLREAGFSFEMADNAWNAIDSHIYGFTLQELNFPFEPEQYADAAETHLDLIPAKTYPYLHGMAQEIIAGGHSGVNDFEFGLQLILDGLERVRTSSSSQTHA